MLIKDSPIIGEKALPIKTGLQLALNTKGRTDGVHFITLSYAIPATPTAVPQALRPENTPYRTYARLVELAAPVSNSPEARAMIIEQVKRERSVLDWVRDDFERLRARLGQRQRAKLESHLTGLREYEQSLTLRETAKPGPPVEIPKTIDQVEANGDSRRFSTSTTTSVAWLSSWISSARPRSSMATATRPGTASTAGPTAAAGAGTAPIRGRRWSCWPATSPAAPGVQDFDGSPLIDNMVMTLSSDVSEQHNHVNVPYLVVGREEPGHQGQPRFDVHPGAPATTSSLHWPSRLA